MRPHQALTRSDTSTASGSTPATTPSYVASHYGVFRVDGQHERVADRWQDTMGFTIVGPGHFLGSGHPDPEETLPSSLGLIESTDSAQTWKAVSLAGEADFHALDAAGDYIYGLDSHTGSLLVSTDGTTWDSITDQPLLDLAVNAGDPETVYATTDRGQLVSSTGGTEPVPVPGAPTLTAVDFEPGGPLVGVTPEGTVMVSPDGRTDWTEAGTLDGPVQALDAAPGRWHAATSTGVYESRDNAAAWTLVLDASH